MRFRLLTMFLLFAVLAKAYDFSSVCQTGQTLYYSVTDTANAQVCVTYPGPSIDSAYLNAERPIGSLAIPQSVVHDGTTYSVTAIERCAFSKCVGLDGTLVIPKSIASIGEYAFLHCGNIKTLNFNAVHCTAAFAAFEGCSFETVIVGNEVTRIPDGLLANSIHITSLVLPNSVQTIGARAFYNCPNLERVALPDSLSEIGSYAFGDCPSVSSLEPVNASSIGLGAFRSAKGLPDICLGNNVSVVAEEAFFGCGNAQRLDFGSNLRKISNHAFYGCHQADTVSCSAIQSPGIVENAFSDETYDGVLLVRCEARENYQTSQEWGRFGEITVTDPLALQAVPDETEHGLVFCSEDRPCLGDYVVLEAAPFEGWCFNRWSDGNESNPRTVRMESDTAFVAMFAIDSTWSCMDAADARHYVTAEGKTVCVHEAMGKTVRIYNLSGTCVLAGRCEERRSCFQLPTSGLHIVCVGKETGCHKVIAE